MDMDEMTDRISMALKDPILQQGFEIICKNLIELGKENAELKSKEYFVGDINRQNMELQQKLEVKEKQIEKLEEAKANYEYLLEGRDNEIDELKKQIDKMKCCRNCKYLAYDYEDMLCSNKKHCKNYNLWKLKE